MIAALQILAILAIGVNGLEFVISGANLNSERLMLPFIIGALLVRTLANKPIVWSFPATLYTGWVLTVGLAAALSSDPVQHINGLLISICPFFYFVLFMQDGLSNKALNRVVTIWVFIVGCASIIITALWAQNGSLDYLMDRGRVKLTMTEPNILGGTVAAYMALYAGLTPRFGLWFGLIESLGLVALVLTASKSPYLAFSISLIYLIYRSGSWKRPSVFFLGTFGLLAAITVAILFSDNINELYSSALDRPDAINNRLFGLSVAWERFLQHPVFGNGPLDFSFASEDILTKFGSDNEKNLWIWQVWVAVLHDEGVLGFVFFVMFILGSWIRCARFGRDGSKKHVGVAASLLCILVVSQATTMHLTAIFGALFGLANSQPPLRVRRMPSKA